MEIIDPLCIKGVAYNNISLLNTLYTSFSICISSFLELIFIKHFYNVSTKKLHRSRSSFDNTATEYFLELPRNLTMDLTAKLEVSLINMTRKSV